MTSDLEMRYQQELQRLSELVQQRDRCLLRLETIASLPLSISPRSGHLAEFDLNGARELLDDIERRTRLIEQAMETANRYADECGRPALVWLNMPRSKRASDEAED